MTWDWGALWGIDRDAGILRCERIWHAPHLETAEFDALSREAAFAPGQGLAGRVWQNPKPAWIDDVTKAPDFLRAPIAARVGLHGAIVFPILLHGEILGVMEFFSRTVRQPEAAQLDTLSAIGSQIGQFVERKRAEEALRKSERQFHALFDEAAIGMALVNAAGHPFESNRALQQMLGYSAEELRGMPFTQFTHPDDVALDWQLFTELVRGQRHQYQLEKRYYRKDGRLVWGNLTVSLVRDERGAPLFGIGMVEDITERKRAEEALRQTRAELAHVSRVMTVGALTASIAHEVNQPLAAVVTNGNACLRWLAREVPDVEEARAAVARVIREANRASEVIRRIRALAQKTDPQAAWLDLNDVIREVVALMHGEARQQRVALRTDLAGALPPVRGDRVQLQQVLLNLLINGIEAMQAVTDRPRELWIRSQRHDADTVLVAVQDGGIGLDPQSMARLFDPFFTTKPGGMGIGLSISGTIIEAHGGRLWATPNDGPGATFQFTLPLNSERQS